MTIQTREGIKIYVLPDCAKCRATGKSPTDMEDCPICNFDDYGDICVPELCDEYIEEVKNEDN